MHKLSRIHHSRILTGKVGREIQFNSMKPLDLSTCTKEQITAYFENSYDLEENLFLSLKDQSSFFLSPNKFRQPIIFYFVHTPTLFVNAMFIGGFIQERIDYDLETRFETGIDEMSWDSVDTLRMGGEIKWPSVESVVEYRRKVRELVLKTIDSTPLELPISWESPWWSLMLSIDHIRVNIEMSSVMLQELPVNLLDRPRAWNYGPIQPDSPIDENELITVPEGTVTLGMPRDFPSYGWDIQFGKEQRETPAFKASKYLTTNAEFLKFVQARGYEEEQYWTVEGWEWVREAKSCHPHFWVCQQGCKSICGGQLSDHTHCQARNGEVAGSNGEHSEQEYLYRAMFDNIKMPWTWPVVVNYHEAKAYCKWRGEAFRLPTEAEHLRLRGEELPAEEGLRSDPGFADKPPFNSNLQFCSSTPVNHFPPSSHGFYDTYGNVWQWTECHYDALEGFQTHKLYDNFSTPAFDGSHNVMMGGCWASSGTLASRYYRNAFRRHFFQHAGFRVVEALDMKNTPVRLCSTRQYTPGRGFIEHPIVVFGSRPARNVRESANEQLKTELDEAFQLEVKHSQTDANIIAKCILQLDRGLGSFIHVGCGLGKVCFILSSEFNSLLGIDYSGRFIEFCNIVKDKSNCTDIVFKQFVWLANEIPASDIVLVTLLDRVMNPEAWTIKLFEIVKPSGIVVVVSKISLETLEGIMTKLQMKSSETPFEDTDLCLSIWQRSL